MHFRLELKNSIALILINYTRLRIYFCNVKSIVRKFSRAFYTYHWDLLEYNFQKYFLFTIAKRFFLIMLKYINKLKYIN